VVPAALERYADAVVKLRFVEEYRGRRIVTDGKLFGIAGELVTDCRYLGLQGAHGAIDSELTIEATKKARSEVTRIWVPCADYFSDYEARAFTCDCGWHGSYHELKRENACCSLLLSCPKCRHPLLSVHAPSDDDIKGAAARGDEEALAMLPSVLESERVEQAWSSQALKSLSQLPALGGDALAFVWDFEQDGGDYHVITLGEHQVWRELARTGDRRRFYEVKRLFKAKYRGRFASLTPTAAARKTLVGANTGLRLSVT